MRNAILMSVVLIVACEKNDNSEPSSGGQSYSFTTSASSEISMVGSTSLAENGFALSDGPTLCSSVVCFTPTVLEGQYYGVGFLLQSAGNGMVSYFGRDSWDDVTESSETYAFSSADPAEHGGDLFCCNGEGDLNNGSSYIENVIYLFSYLDATFTISGVTGNTSMNKEVTVRFILADGGVSGAKRGDLMIKDEDEFKWMDTSTSAGGIVGDGTLVTTRPSSPATMNTSVKNWTNPFGGDGNDEIPVIYVPVESEKASERIVVSESMLKKKSKIYRFGFDPSNFVMFPELLDSDINSISSYSQLLKYIHLGGLPHSKQSNGVGNPASTVLTID